MQFENTAAFAQAQDENDPLRDWRSKFYIPVMNGTEVIYFTGNSLGLQPQTTQDYVLDALEDWANFGVEGHFHGRKPWLSYHELFPQKIGRLVGALPQEVVVMNQLTVNLHLLMTTFYRPTPTRYKIICEARAFPSDQYAFESQVRLHGYAPEEAIIEVAPRPGEHHLRTEDILDAIATHAGSAALVLFGGLNYYTGQVFDMAAIAKQARQYGIYVGFDLAHAIGNVPLSLHDWGADFACWCSYKYLNSGPGGVSGIFIHNRHVANAALPRMAGWWGHDKESRFRMEKGFQPIPTAEGWQLSNAPVLSMAAHLASVDVFDAVGMEALRAKSLLLSDYLLYLLDAINTRFAKPVLEIITPRAPHERGCQVSTLVLEQGRAVFDALTQQGVLADWREPNVIRVAPVPLYNSFMDVYRFGQIISEIVSAIHQR
jgi:kynureninase